jgi:hypothetical protein
MHNLFMNFYYVHWGAKVWKPFRAVCILVNNSKTFPYFCPPSQRGVLLWGLVFMGNVKDEEKRRMHI